MVKVKYFGTTVTNKHRIPEDKENKCEGGRLLGYRDVYLVETCRYNRGPHFPHRGSDIIFIQSYFTNIFVIYIYKLRNYWNRVVFQEPI